MNIFIFDNNVHTNAMYYPDVYLNKMILEYTQILSTVNRLKGYGRGYKSTHAYHPATQWALESKANYEYLYDLTIALGEERFFRFPDKAIHRSLYVLKTLKEPPLSLPNKQLTKFRLIMPDEYKSSNVTKSYREYFRNEKQNLFKWTNRPTPTWIKKELAYV